MKRAHQIDETFIEVAKTISKLSHCRSYQVGAVIVKNGRILSTGYNGTPSGHQNCDDLFPSKHDPLFDREAHHKFSELYEIHAEQNSVAYASRYGISLEGSTVYCTLQPCMTCAKILVAVGIVRIVYADVYDKTDTTMESFLDASSISISKFLPV